MPRIQALFSSNGVWYFQRVSTKNEVGGAQGERKSTKPRSPEVGPPVQASKATEGLGDNLLSYQAQVQTLLHAFRLMGRNSKRGTRAVTAGATAAGAARLGHRGQNRPLSLVGGSQPACCEPFHASQCPPVHRVQYLPLRTHAPGKDPVT